MNLPDPEYLAKAREDLAELPNWKPPLPASPPAESENEYAKRNRERAMQSVAARRGSSVCPKNGDLGHKFEFHRFSQSAHKFPVQRCRKCLTLRTVYPEGYKRPVHAIPAAPRKDDRICPQTGAHHRWREVPESDGVRRNECRDCRTRRKVAA